MGPSRTHHSHLARRLIGGRGAVQLVVLELDGRHLLARGGMFGRHGVFFEQRRSGVERTLRWKFNARRTQKSGDIYTRADGIRRHSREKDVRH